MAQLKLPDQLRTLDSSLPASVDGATLQDILAFIKLHHPAVHRALMADDRKIRPFVRIYVGETFVTHDLKSSIPVRGNDTIRVLMASAGG